MRYWMTALLLVALTVGYAGQTHADTDSDGDTASDGGSGDSGDGPGGD